MALILCQKVDSPELLDKRVARERRGMVIDIREDDFVFSEWERTYFDLIKVSGAASEYAFLLERGSVDPITGECAGLRKVSIDLDALAQDEALDQKLGVVKCPLKSDLIAAAAEAASEKTFAVEMATKIGKDVR